MFIHMHMSTPYTHVIMSRHTHTHTIHLQTPTWARLHILYMQNIDMGMHACAGRSSMPVTLISVTQVA